MSDTGTIWLVLVNGETREADVARLRHWAERRLIRPATRVRTLDGEWVDAGSVPALAGIFPAETTGVAPVAPEPVAAFDVGVARPAAPHAPARGGEGCANHPEERPRYACRSCAARLCAACVRLANGVPICPKCGELCERFDVVERAAAVRADQTSGFGARDVAIGLGYPFRDMTTLVFGSLIYGGALYVSIAGALFLALPFAYAPNRPALLIGPLALLLAPASLQFAYVAHVVERVGRGELDEPAPDFAESLVVLLASRAALVVAVVLVSLGPLVVGWALVGRGDLGHPAVLVTAAWALVELPAAVIVASVTGSAVATANPVAGLATVWRMGWEYAGVLPMVLVVGGLETALVGVTAANVVWSGLGAAPTIGAIVLALPLAVPGFACNLAIGALLGRAVYKSAHRLGTPVTGLR